MSENFDLELPPRYGTNNCYDCGAEPEGLQPFWERFVIIHGEQVSVPQCAICMSIMMDENSGTKAPDQSEQMEGV